jgi:N-acetylglucosamine-6-phosphate deacetylase
LLKPDTSWVEKWQSACQQQIQMVTLAPELPHSHELIQYLKQHQIVASMGHSDATYAETVSAIEQGCSHVTHLFNAMSGIHQREPGVVTGALLSSDVSVELIADGMHLHPAIVQLILRVKDKEKIVLVTDAMRAKCMRDGVYDLGGQAVVVRAGVARLANGTLAGSTLKMSQAIQNMLQFTDCTLWDVCQFASRNPAQVLNIFDRKGSIRQGKDADIVVLDEQYQPVLTVCEGRIVADQQVLSR